MDFCATDSGIIDHILFRKIDFYENNMPVSFFLSLHRLRISTIMFEKRTKKSATPGNALVDHKEVQFLNS